MSNTPTATTMVEPDPGEIQRAAAEAMNALRSARAQLQQEADALKNERTMIESEQRRLSETEAQVAHEREAQEAQLQRLDTLARDLSKQRDELQASITELDRHRIEIQAEREALNENHEKFAHERQSCATMMRELAVKEADIERTRKQYEQLASELEPRRLAIEQDEVRLAAQRDQLEAYASELEDTRQALVTMQEQLTHEQQELNAQRGELLQKIGGIPRIAAAPSIAPKPASPPDVFAEVASGPKPAASSAAEQFRKLRRDAKRRAIGV